MRTLSFSPRGAVMAMDRSGSSSPEAEAVTLTKWRWEAQRNR